MVYEEECQGSLLSGDNIILGDMQNILVCMLILFILLSHNYRQKNK